MVTASVTSDIVSLFPNSLGSTASLWRQLGIKTGLASPTQQKEDMGRWGGGGGGGGGGFCVRGTLPPAIKIMILLHTVSFE